MSNHSVIFSTFSIVARCPRTGDFGVAVTTARPAVGAVVPWAQANAGVIATQSYANTTFGPKGLRLLAKDLSAQETLDRLLAADKGRAQRQVGVVDRQGHAATFTGSSCHAWAGGLTGRYFAVQGNILARARVVEAIAAKYETAKGELAWLLRLGGNNMNFNSGSFEMRRLKITSDGLERFGKGIVMDMTKPDGERILVWTE